jgi:hypothetical protein
MTYVASRIRATKVEMEARREALFEIVAEGEPMTVRHAYYRAVVAGLVPKNDSGYNKVQRCLADMREDGDLPFEWISDNTRWMRKPTTWNDLDQFLENAASSYRRDLWSTSKRYVEVWCESDSIAGVLADVTYPWHVPLLPARGFSSKTFAYSAARTIMAKNKPTFIYYIGDRDPAGLEIEHALRASLDRYAPDHKLIFFQRLAVTEEQVEELDLPGTKPKKTTVLGERFVGNAVEVEAIPAPYLRELVEDAILAHVDGHHLELLKVAEEEERTLLERFARREFA